jgi:hypothetical protein
MKNALSRSKILVVSLMLSIGLLSTSCGSGTSAKNISIPGVSKSAITLNNDAVLITFVFDNIQLDGGLRYNIPKYPNSYIEISPDLQSAGTLMAINVGIKDALNTSLQMLDPQTLPGGRALPGVNGGRMPAVAFSIEKFHNMAFYIGPKLFGVFIPVHLNMQGTMLTARYFVSNSRVGNISIVGEDANGENSGILLLLDMSTQVQQQLKSVAKM